MTIPPQQCLALSNLENLAAEKTKKGKICRTVFSNGSENLDEAGSRIWVSSAGRACKKRFAQVGRVLTVADGIARIYGLKTVKAGTIRQ